MIEGRPSPKVEGAPAADVSTGWDILGKDPAKADEHAHAMPPTGLTWFDPHALTVRTAEAWERTKTEQQITGLKLTRATTDVKVFAKTVRAVTMKDSPDWATPRPIVIAFGGWATTGPPTVVEPTPFERARFATLVSQWRNDTGASSSITEKFMHSDYQKIIGMGKPGIRLVLEELERELDHWFWALSAMAPRGENPAKDAQTLEEARDLWLAWGRRNSFLPEAVAVGA